MSHETVGHPPLAMAGGCNLDTTHILNFPTLKVIVKRLNLVIPTF